MRMRVFQRRYWNFATSGSRFRCRTGSIRSMSPVRARSFSTRLRSRGLWLESLEAGSSGLDQLLAREEKSDFDPPVLRRVGAMDDVLTLVVCVEFANRTRGGIFRIGGTDKRPELRDGILPFQSDRDARSGTHELNEPGVEGSPRVDGIKLSGAPGAQARLFHADDLEARLLNSCDDLSRNILPDAIGF